MQLSFFAKAAAAMYLVREYVIELTVCVGPSMLPTFNVRGDVALLEHISVWSGKIEVGDVVVARSMQNPRHVVCKRVLALEGDTIPSQQGPTWSLGKEIKVPKGHVWLQGDNIYNSTDSRHYGPVPYALLRGRVFSFSAPTKYAELGQQEQQKIDTYLDTLLEWNTKMNLTAITDRDEAYDRHINDSLVLLPVIDSCLAEANVASSEKPVNLIDVGSGAGLPGIVLAVTRPEWNITLLDSLQKRCNFLKEAAAETALQNIAIECARAEDAGQDPLLREQYLLVVARAVAELRVLAELCLPLVAPGGYWIAAKGANPDKEVEAAAKAIKTLGGQLCGVYEVDSVGPDGKRTAIVVKKVGKTPTKYPRKPGTPKKQPL